MFKNSDNIKRLNMKIAGTLAKPVKTINQNKENDEDKEGKVWDTDMEGLTAK